MGPGTSDTRKVVKGLPGEARVLLKEDKGVRTFAGCPILFSFQRNVFRPLNDNEGELVLSSNLRPTFYSFFLFRGKKRAQLLRSPSPSKLFNKVKGKRIPAVYLPRDTQLGRIFVCFERELLAG